jgi:hypothetical protein
MSTISAKQLNTMINKGLNHDKQGITILPFCCVYGLEFNYLTPKTRQTPKTCQTVILPFLPH